MNQRQKKQIIMNQRKSASKKIPNTKTQIPNSKNKNLLFREDTNQGYGI